MRELVHDDVLEEKEGPKHGERFYVRMDRYLPGWRRHERLRSGDGVVARKLSRMDRYLPGWRRRHERLRSVDGVVARKLPEMTGMKR